MKTFFLVTGLLLVSLAGCRQPCSPTNCTGCCDASGSCQVGTTPQACGVSGGACNTCLLGQSCNLGQCFGATGAGGGGGASGGGTGGGTSGGGGGASGGGGGGVSTFDAFCEAYVRESYGLYGRCGAATPAALEFYIAYYTRLTCGQGTPAGLKDGRSTLSQSTIDTCLATLRSATCTNLQSCTGDLFVGTVGQNGSCYDSSDCQSALYCDVTTTCPGRCVPRIAIGQPVAPMQECVKNASVYNGQCVALVPAGQSCAPMGGSSATQSCAPPATCLPSQLCGTQTRAALNQPCSGDSDCQLGAQCANSVCVALGTLNAACDSVRECQLGLRCSTANVCVDASPVAIGGTCDAQRPCNTEVSFCDVQGGSTGTCVGLRGVNGTCASGSQCQRGLVCSGPLGSSVCITPLALNAACSFTSLDEPCGAGLYCTATSMMTSGVCANRKGEGASCTVGRECQSSGCNSGLCSRPSCEDPTP